MAKILRIENKNMVEEVEKLLEDVKAGIITSFIFAGKIGKGGGKYDLEEGCVCTAWASADLGTRQELIGHLQADVFLGVVEAN